MCVDIGALVAMCLVKVLRSMVDLKSQSKSYLARNPFMLTIAPL